MKMQKIGNFAEWRENQLVKYVKCRVNHLIKKSKTKIKSYKFLRLKEELETIFKYAAPLQFAKYKAVLTRTINQEGCKYFDKNLTRVKHATTVDIGVIKDMAYHLSKQGWQEILTAIALLMTHYTGARAGEICKLFWEDWKKIQNNTGKFWVFILRTSKSNKLAQNAEQLTFQRHPSKQLFEKLFTNYWKVSGKPKAGLMFPKEWMSTRNLNYRLKIASQELGIDPKITCHSGRSWAAQQLALRGADLATINIFMRWSPNSKMFYKYRNLAIEETKQGGAHYLLIPEWDG